MISVLEHAIERLDLLSIISTDFGGSSEALGSLQKSDNTAENSKKNTDATQSVVRETGDVAPDFTHKCLNITVSP